MKASENCIFIFEMLQGIMVDFDFDSDLRLVVIHHIEIFIYYVTLFEFRIIVSVFGKFFIEPFRKSIVSLTLEFVSFSVHPITSICESLNGLNSKHFLLFSDL